MKFSLYTLYVQCDFSVPDFPAFGPAKAFSAVRLLSGGEEGEASSWEGDWLAHVTDVSPDLNNSEGNEQRARALFLSSAGGDRRRRFPLPYRRHDLATHSFAADAIPVAGRIMVGMKSTSIYSLILMFLSRATVASSPWTARALASSTSST